MTTAIDISRRFCQQEILPLLRKRHGSLVDRLAVGVMGTGSDVLGLDDVISRDHHWGPRAAVLLLDADAEQVEAVRDTLAAGCPPAFEGHPIHHDASNRTGVCVDHVSSYLHWFLGTASVPQRDEDWFALCETDLLHMTGGEVFHDSAGEWSAIRQRLNYYPDRVWHKRLADWCMYVSGRDSPYNLYRVSRRGDRVACQMYFGVALRRVMEMGFALERRYAPYPKWQYRLFHTLGGCIPRVLPILDRLVSNDAIGDSRGGEGEKGRGGEIDWRARIDTLIEIKHIYAHQLHELGLTGPPVIKPFDEGLTDLTLYSSAKEIYAQLPPAWLDLSFNPIESWEKLARRVLFDSGDYFQKRFGNT